jgi:DNA-binding XRE family transcriptional regulator
MRDPMAEYHEGVQAGAAAFAAQQEQEERTQSEAGLYAPPGGIMARDAEGFVCYWEGSRLAAARNERGLSQRALADKLGLSQPTIQRWEVDDRVPSADFILKLAEVLLGDRNAFCAFFTRDHALASAFEGFQRLASNAEHNGHSR